MSRQKTALREALTEILSCALEPDSEIQRLAEERKKALEMTEEYPFLLIEIIQSSEEAMDEKVMAAIFLKNYLYDFYKETHPEQMLMNSSSLLSKLSHDLIDIMVESHMIRPMMCKALTYLVYIGFWPCIDNKIMSMLQSENEESLCAAVLFLKYLFEFDCGISISPEYFEALLNIFQRSYNSTLKADTVSSMLCILQNSFQNQPSLADATNRLGQSFDRTLREPYSASNNFFVKSEIIRGILYIFLYDDIKYDETISNGIIIPCLPAIGQLMIYCCHEYKQIIVENQQIPRDAEEDTKDPKNFCDLINNIQDLVNRLINSSHYFPLLMDGLDDLLYCLFVFMCSQDTYSVFLEYDEKPINFAIREGALQALSTIMVHLQGNPTFFKSLHNVFLKHITECTTQRVSSPLYYAKILESLMFGMGVLRDFFPEHTIFARDEVFPHSYYLETWNTLLSESNYLIIGRILWLGGKYSASLNPSTLELQIKTILKYIEDYTESIYDPLSEALQYHIAAYEYSPLENRIVINNLVNDISHCIFKMTQIKSIKPAHYLNSLGNLYKNNIDVMRHYVNNTLDVLTAAIKYMSNIGIMKEINFLTSQVTKHECNREAVHNNLRPFIMKMVYNNQQRKTPSRKDIQEKGLELLNTIIINSPEPINDLIVHESFYAAVNIILNSEDVDNNTIEAAVHLIIMMLIKLSPQIKTLRTEKGLYLADFVPKIIFELLDPAKSVWTGKVGKLCVTSIITLNEKMEPHLESLLKSVLSCVLVKSSLKKLEAVWLIFAYIFMYKPADTINFLSSIPGPTGGSALAYLINKWRPEYFREIGNFEKTIITVAITHIIAYAIEENNDRINDVTIKLSNKKSDKECTGIEYMYILLVQILLDAENTLNKTEDENNRTRLEEEEDHCLFKTLLPFSNVNIESHIKSFLKNYTSYYFNVVRNFYFEDMNKLASLGLFPELSME